MRTLCVYVAFVVFGFIFWKGEFRHVDMSQAAPLGLGAGAQGLLVLFNTGEVLCEWECAHVSGLQVKNGDHNSSL